MRLQQKYFKPFIGIMALIAAIAIVIGTIEYREFRVEQFRQKIMNSDSLGLYRFKSVFSDDSLRLSEIGNGYVVLDFWATWSDLSIQSHLRLSKMVKRNEGLTVLAASVKDNESNIRSYQKRHGFPFIYVDGTEFYNSYNVPGLPTQVVFNNQGEVENIYIGYTDSLRYMSVEKFLSDE